MRGSQNKPSSKRPDKSGGCARPELGKGKGRRKSKAAVKLLGGGSTVGSGLVRQPVEKKLQIGG